MLVVINNEATKKKQSEKENTLRYYGMGAQIIKDFKIRNMILISRTKKNNRFRRVWFKNKKTNNY